MGRTGLTTRKRCLSMRALKRSCAATRRWDCSSPIHIYGHKVTPSPQPVQARSTPGRFIAYVMMSFSRARAPSMSPLSKATRIAFNASLTAGGTLSAD